MRWICLFWVGLFFLMHCEQQQQCVGDRDCIDRFGNDFVCVSRKCVAKNQLEGVAEVVDAESTPERKVLEELREQVQEIEVGLEQIVEEIKEEELRCGLPLKKLHESCSDAVLGLPHERCVVGLRCLRVDSKKAICVQDCTGNSSVCKSNVDGRTVCHQVAWEPNDLTTSLKACVLFRKKGESCDSSQSLYCQPGQSPHLVCNNGLCEEGVLCEEAGCACPMQGGKPVECTLSKKLVCDRTLKACIHGVTAYEGMRCGKVNGTTTQCPEGYECLCPPGRTCPRNQPFTCLRLCTPNPGNPVGACSSHRSGFLCQEVSLGKGVCIQDNCVEQSDCVLQAYPHVCDGGPNNRTCQPKPRIGTSDFGKPCGSGCKSPFVCVSTQEGGKTLSYCTLQCNVNRVPDVCGPLLCSQLNGSTCALRYTASELRYCGWSCANGGTCPKGMRCWNKLLCFP